MHGVAGVRDVQCLPYGVGPGNMHCSGDSPSPTRLIKHFAESLAAHQTMNLNSIGTHCLREPHDLVRLLQMGDQHGRDIRRGSCHQLGRTFLGESVLTSMGDAADKADGICPGSDGDPQIGC